MGKKIDPQFREWEQITAIAERFNVSPDTIEDWIKQGKLTERIHFTRMSDRMRLFNVNLIRDRIANWDDDTAHQKGIRVYLDSLLSNQSSKRQKAG